MDHKSAAILVCMFQKRKIGTKFHINTYTLSHLINKIPSSFEIIFVFILVFDLMADAIMSMALLNRVAFFYQAQSSAIGISNNGFVWKWTCPQYSRCFSETSFEWSIQFKSQFHIKQENNIHLEAIDNHHSFFTYSKSN